MNRAGLASLMVVLSACAPRASRPFDASTIACEAPATDDSAAHPRAADYQALLDELRREGLPGAVLGISDKHGTWFGASGSAALDPLTPMKPCHRTPVLSTTKLFTAVTVLKLIEREKLSLDDTIARWLPPEVARKLKYADSITVRHLLSHTSGLSDLGQTPFEVVNGPYQPLDEGECLAALTAVSPAQARPGTFIHFSSVNFDLLGLYVVPAASGTSMQAALDEAVLTPLGLGATSFPESLTTPWTGTVPSYADVLNDGESIRTDDFLRTKQSNCRGSASGLASNAYDLMTFLDALFRKKTLVSPATLEAMQRNHGSPEWIYGLGVSLWESPQGLVLGHEGMEELGYRIFAFHLPAHDVSVVYWFNTAPVAGDTSERAATEWIGSLARILALAVEEP